MSKKIIFPWRIINFASAIAMKLPQNEPNHNIKFSTHQHVRIFHSFWLLRRSLFCNISMRIRAEHFSESRLTWTAQLRKQLFCPGPLRSPFVSVVKFKWCDCEGAKIFLEFCIKICCCWKAPIVIVTFLLLWVLQLGFKSSVNEWKKNWS